VAKVALAPAAVADLDALIGELDLPRDTRARVRTRLSQLAEFPESGEALSGRWQGFRYLLGPWSWMLILYAYDEDADHVAIVTIQDARRSRSATSDR